MPRAERARPYATAHRGDVGRDSAKPPSDAVVGAQARELHELPPAAHMAGPEQRMRDLSRRQGAAAPHTEPGRARDVHHMPRRPRTAADGGCVPYLPCEDQGTPRRPRPPIPQGLRVVPRPAPALARRHTAGVHHVPSHAGDRRASRARTPLQTELLRVPQAS